MCFSTVLKQGAWMWGKGGRFVKLDSETLHTHFSEQIFSHTELALILLDRHARILKITPAAAEILGESHENLIYKSIFQLFNQLMEELRVVVKSILNGLPIRNKAMMWNNGDRQYELLIDTYPLTDTEGQFLGSFIILKDVSSIHFLENQIRRSERLAMIGQMAAGTAHEIRNPLTSIKGFLQMIKKSLEANGLEKELGYTQIMLEEINRINHLVGEFLLLSKSKKVKYDKIDVSQLMQQFLPMVQNEALLHGIEVYADDFSSLPHIYGDQELLKQVFLNICKNAIEAMGNEGILTISKQLFPGERRLSIDFQDTGPGIPNYLLDKIFEPFFTTKEEGTGLGLPVCQRIIHDMGGKIRITSKGFGTIFHIELPCV